MTKLVQTETVTFGEVMPPNWVTAIDTISNRLPVEKKLNDDEDKALWLLDEKWMIEMLWVAYVFNPVVDTRYKPFNTPYFQAYKTSGKSYAEQLRLTVEVWDRLPQHNFDSPMDWWVQQMLDCKRFDYRWALEESSKPRSKKKSMKSNRLQVKILKGVEGTAQDRHELIDGFSLAMPSMGLLLRKAVSLAKNSQCKKGKRFITQYWMPYLESVRDEIEYSDRGGHAKNIRLIQKLEDKVYVTAPRRPLPLLR